MSIASSLGAGLSLGHQARSLDMREQHYQQQLEAQRMKELEQQLEAQQAAIELQAAERQMLDAFTRFNPAPTVQQPPAGGAAGPPNLVQDFEDPSYQAMQQGFGALPTAAKGRVLERLTTNSTGAMVDQITQQAADQRIARRATAIMNDPLLTPEQRQRAVQLLKLTELSGLPANVAENVLDLGQGGAEGGFDPTAWGLDPGAAARLQFQQEAVERGILGSTVAQELRTDPQLPLLEADFRSLQRREKMLERKLKSAQAASDAAFNMTGRRDEQLDAEVAMVEQQLDELQRAGGLLEQADRAMATAQMPRRLTAPQPTDPDIAFIGPAATGASAQRTTGDIGPQDNSQLLPGEPEASGAHPAPPRTTQAPPAGGQAGVVRQATGRGGIPHLGQMPQGFQDRGSAQLGQAIQQVAPGQLISASGQGAVFAGADGQPVQLDGAALQAAWQEAVRRLRAQGTEPTQADKDLIVQMIGQMIAGTGGR